MPEKAGKTGGTIDVDTNMKIGIKEALKFQKTGDYIHIFIDLENEISFIYS
jgi:hypothetical protein